MFKKIIRAVWIPAAALLAAILLAPAGGAMAQTENITSISGNLTITNNITGENIAAIVQALQGIQEAEETRAAVEQDRLKQEQENGTVTRMQFEAFIMLAFIGLALWRKSDIIFFFIAAAVTSFIGFSWVDDYLAISLLVLGMSLYLLFETVLLAVGGGERASGWAELKSWYQKVMRRRHNDEED